MSLVLKHVAKPIAGIVSCALLTGAVVSPAEALTIHYEEGHISQSITGDNEEFLDSGIVTPTPEAMSRISFNLFVETVFITVIGMMIHGMRKANGQSTMSDSSEGSANGSS